jgi:GrpB-like predicted nucleotidyltransferase (UPF0157 family)
VTEETNTAEMVRRLCGEQVDIVDYDPRWPALFLAEKEHLLRCLPPEIVRRIEHFGSTAVPGLAAKPVIDMLVEVSDLEATKRCIAPLLVQQGYEYIWRPTIGDDGPPFYAWFIKRDAATGARTHHIHMVEASFASHWERLLFRDYLIEHPEFADEYGRLKLELTARHPNDRAAYTQGKTEFVTRMTEQAKRYYGASQQ